jgi:hypothetical protein
MNFPNQVAEKIRSKIHAKLEARPKTMHFG